MNEMKIKTNQCRNNGSRDRSIFSMFSQADKSGLMRQQRSTCQTTNNYLYEYIKKKKRNKD